MRWKRYRFKSYREFIFYFFIYTAGDYWWVLMKSNKNQDELLEKIFCGWWRLYKRSYSSKLAKDESWEMLKSEIVMSLRACTFHIYCSKYAWGQDKKELIGGLYTQNFLCSFKGENLFLSYSHHLTISLTISRRCMHIYPTPPLGQDMTQGQFLSGV